MELPRIAAAATATPAQRFTQAELLAMAGYQDDAPPRLLRGERHRRPTPTSTARRFRPDESVDELSDRFRRGALELGEAALRSALDRAGWRPEDVDFLATTTCTGRMTPSLDAHMVARLGCRRDVQRVHVGDTGCAAAVVALAAGLQSHPGVPGHRALVLAVEICSAAYSSTTGWRARWPTPSSLTALGQLALVGDGGGPGHR